MTKDTTCATILEYDDKILVCHATNQSHWDLPKGLKEPCEYSHEAASRELKEETGIVLDSSTLLPICYDNYNSKKNIVLYGYHLAEKPLNLTCVSTFIPLHDVYVYPEVDDYKWVTLDEFIIITSKSMGNFIKNNYNVIQNFLTSG